MKHYSDNQLFTKLSILLSYGLFEFGLCTLKSFFINTLEKGIRFKEFDEITRFERKWKGICTFSTLYYILWKVIESIKINVSLLGRTDRLFGIVRNGEKISCSVRLIAKVFGLIVTISGVEKGPLIHK